MPRLVRAFAPIAALVAVSIATPAAQTASLQSDFLKDWTALKDTMMKIAEAMPESKYSFKATPPERTYGEQVMHVAAINMLVLQTLGAKARAPRINDKATSKADTMKAMADSFDYGAAILKEQTDQSMAAGVQGPPWMGPSTRARIFAFLVGHTYDTYGQMAVYLRLNGLVPPASQRP
jgi:uncharacterized damage-inducible protein DinB